MRCSALLLGISLLAACSQPVDSPAPAADEVPATPDASSAPATQDPTPPAPEGPQPVANAAFAPPPASGQVVRVNCHMGACTWVRYESATRSGGDDAPKYTMQVTQGESRHPDDPYPTVPEGVAITWDAAPVSAEVSCSTSTPFAGMAGDGHALKLNPQGVAGVAQALANLYFATCHGETGNDAELARKYGYDIR